MSVEAVVAIVSVILDGVSRLVQCFASTLDADDARRLRKEVTDAMIKRSVDITATEAQEWSIARGKN